MTLQICKDYDALSSSSADQIATVVERKPGAVLCLAAGDTPRLAYQMLVKTVRSKHLDLSGCTFIGLDEWVEIPPENEGSCAFFLRENLFNPMGIRAEQVHLFNSMSEDIFPECEKMDRLILEKGGIDLMLVGVGMNGHVGFNEPGISENLGAHVVTLDETTKRIGQKYFAHATKLQYGITLGLRHFLESRMAILIASGEKKAEVIRRTLEGPVTTVVPASLIRKHSNGLVLLDEDAARLLKG